MPQKDHGLIETTTRWCRAVHACPLKRIQRDRIDSALSRFVT